MSPGPEQVRTTAGAVRGRVEDGVTVFRGIPFAQPPVGGLRFAAPRRVDAWDGVRPATDFGPPPPQSARGGRDDAPANGWADPYDWLTVNVWTPDPGAARLPVMVYLYGGALMLGHGGQPEYDGTAFARSKPADPTLPPLLGDPPPDDAAAVSRAMHEAWTRFAADGDPGWPAFTPDTALVKVFDAESAVRPYPHEASRRMWRDHAFTPVDLKPGSSPPL